jgi:hypothetical protein
MRQEEFSWGAGPFDWLADLRTRQIPEQALRLGVGYAADPGGVSWTTRLPRGTTLSTSTLNLSRWL